MELNENDNTFTKEVKTAIFNYLKPKYEEHRMFLSVSSMALAAMDDDDDDMLGKKKNKRGVLPKQATQVMRSWLFQHIVVSDRDKWIMLIQFFLLETTPWAGPKVVP